MDDRAVSTGTTRASLRQGVRGRRHRLHGAPSVVGQHPTPTGAVLDLELSPRCTAKDLALDTEPLAVALGAADGADRGGPDGRRSGPARRGQPAIHWPDAPIPWPWIGIGRTHLWGGLPLGHDEDDGLVVLELAGHHLLLGGEPGAGKSNALSLVVAAAALDPDAELWCFDGKLVELAAWRNVADGSSVRTSRRPPRRSASCGPRWRPATSRSSSGGSGRWTGRPDSASSSWSSTSWPSTPRARARPETSSCEVLRDIVARGRAAGIVVVAATQKPASDIVPTSIRDLFGCRLAMRCSTRDASDTVLGAGWSTLGLLGLRHRPGQPGRGLPAGRRDDAATDAVLRPRRPPAARLGRRAERTPGGRIMTATTSTVDDRIDERRVIDGIVARLNGPGGLDAFTTQVRAVRGCRRPVRLSGRVIGIGRRRSTGGPLRHPATCPTGCCSRRAGPGGRRCARRVPPSTGATPSPSWRQACAAARASPRRSATTRQSSSPSPHPASGPCTGGARTGPATRGARVVPMGRRSSAVDGTAARDEALGQALCPDCYDYEGAVLFNAGVSELWRRTTIYALRALGSLLGLSARQAARQLRLSYVKVVEFQRRGSVHLHALVRADVRADEHGEAPDGIDADTAGHRPADRRPEGQRPAARAGRRPSDGVGDQIDAAVVADADNGRRRAAAYLAKYATKGSDEHGVLDHRLRSGPAEGRAAARPPPGAGGDGMGPRVTTTALADFRLAAVGPHVRVPGPLPHQVPALLDDVRGTSGRTSAVAPTAEGAKSSRGQVDGGGHNP